MKSIFLPLETPEHIISDSGPCCSSKEFKEFAHAWNFSHVMCAHPDICNPMERSVQTVKSLFTQAKADKKDLLIDLFEYRATPLDTGRSPAKILFVDKFILSHL